ncbi:tetraacyldisaccharide 4'-kinase [Leptospira hartskeerlii]|uniref:Tetraacyldisaccharide 4'-kinase n=1 Tax=Leptospira hartskeerlii TaxID=2023177 RepID=A0A2M9XII7_9LEPT|nr:tetraacyldisaccharide 4'-kinase [Leptospira hartskeerlii]PJZ27469.1 tetraacyldisaccharide 4'-kinase [Leptospira hartskeerlii]PJZ32326.1 tetraacyldisaccharide 4'-kinase [Leptospira hartskeerlii]
MISFGKILFFPILFILSQIYKILFFLDRSFKKKRTLPSSVTISIGNFSVGGTGKTPFTLHLAKLLHSNFPNIPIVILSRGYGSSGAGTRKVSENSSPAEIGDEPLLLKKNLPFAEVYVGSNRYDSYLQFRSENKLANDQKVFALLDDGFQHHALNRDLDLVLLDCTKLSKKEFVLPMGLLRESYASVSRANFLVASKFSEEYEDSLSKWIKKYRPSQTLRFRFFPQKLVPLSFGSSEISVKELTGKSVFAFAGLGNPGSFYSSLKDQNPSELKTKSYPDHYSYTKEDLIQISEKAPDKNYIVCTEKDGVKISSLIGTDKNSSNWFYLRLETILENESELIKSIRSFI